MACWKFYTISFLYLMEEIKSQRLGKVIFSWALAFRLYCWSVWDGALKEQLENKSLIMCFIKAENCWGNEMYSVWLIQCIPISEESYRTRSKVWDGPALTVTASTNCSRQEWVPINSARLVFLISLSTVLWNTSNIQFWYAAQFRLFSWPTW